MGKKIILGIDNFAQAGETTLLEIANAAAAQSGNAAEIIRDPSTGKVIQVNVNLPDNASQVAIDAISANKGVATSLQFPTVLLDENFDAVSIGDLPVASTFFQWFRSKAGVGVASDFSVSAPNSMKLPVLSGVRTQVVADAIGNPSLLSLGRTIQTELKFRLSGNDGTILGIGGSPITQLFMDTGDLKIDRFAASPVTVVTGLAVDTFHTIKTVWLVGSNTINVTINGVPKGDFTQGSPTSGAYVDVRFDVPTTQDLWIDDLKVTSIG